MHPQLTLMLFLLKIRRNLSFCGKCLDAKLRKDSPVFFNIFTVRRVVPDNIALSGFSCSID